MASKKIWTSPTSSLLAISLEIWWSYSNWNSLVPILSEWSRWKWPRVDKYVYKYSSSGENGHGSSLYNWPFRKSVQLFWIFKSTKMVSTSANIIGDAHCHLNFHKLSSFWFSKVIWKIQSFTPTRIKINWGSSNYCLMNQIYYQL